MLTSVAGTLSSGRAGQPVTDDRILAVPGDRDRARLADHRNDGFHFAGVQVHNDKPVQGPITGQQPAIRSDRQPFGDDADGNAPQNGAGRCLDFRDSTVSAFRYQHLAGAIPNDVVRVAQELDLPDNRAIARIDEHETRPSPIRDGQKRAVGRVRNVSRRPIRGSVA